MNILIYLLGCVIAFCICASMLRDEEKVSLQSIKQKKIDNIKTCFYTLLSWVFVLSVLVLVVYYFIYFGTDQDIKKANKEGGGMK